MTRVKSLNLLSHSYSFEHRSFLSQALFNNNVNSALLVLNNARFTCFVVYLTTLSLSPARLRQIIGLLIHNKSEWIIFMCSTTHFHISINKTPTRCTCIFLHLTHIHVSALSDHREGDLVTVSLYLYTDH